MAAAQQEDDRQTCSSQEMPSLPLRGIFEIDKIPCDVVLDNEEYVSWSIIQPTGKDAKVGSNHQRLYLREVFAVRIKRYQRSGRKSGYAQGVTLFTRKPKRGSCLLRQGNVTLCAANEETCQMWAKAIGQIIKGYADRPKMLHVFIDTQCENGNAMQIFHKKVQPLLQLAKIAFEIVDSSQTGHVKQILQTMNYEGIDGIICVGDDKIVTEVSNGLLLRTQSDAQLPIKPDHTHLAKCCIPLGIIPVGPFNLVAHSSQGASDPVTSTLHIIYGTTHPIDVCTLFQDDKLIKFGFSAMYGFGGDCLRRAEKKKKLLGKRRAEYAVARSILKLKPYECEVSFLPCSSDVDGCIPDRTPCQAGCRICQTDGDHRSPTQPPSWANNSPQALKKGPALASFLRIPHINAEDSADNSSISSYASSEGRRTPQLYQSSESIDRRRPSSGNSWTQGFDEYLNGQPAVVAKEQGAMNRGIASHFVKLQQRVEGIAVLPERFENSSNDWRTVDGAFLNVSLMTLPNLCSLCPGGMSPQTHLADGSADLILARTTTKAEFVQHLRRYATEKDQFDLPFMCVRRIKAVRFTPKAACPRTNDSTTVIQQSKMELMSNESGQDVEEVGSADQLSVWNIDMEMYPAMSLEIRVHKQLLTVYGAGVAFIDKSPATCGCL
ncbi:ceramide kinase-like protein [Amphiura filiformis]|uniref:ceramide kinase-like protein n=1 Tax=Amphiura filiformis TaxID=82378 RepID=UPI003B221335